MTLADVILRAAELREESWNDTSSINRPGGEYTLTIRDACRKASENVAEVELAIILLTVAWNDALDWAKRWEGEPWDADPSG